jgi:chloramphenicol 3-O phosphotransferase
VGTATPGQIVILNGVPRSGKTSIALALQERGRGVWVNLGVDASAGTLPERFLPGIGLRPGGERADLEDLVVTLYAALWDSVVAHARHGLNVVVDVGLHDAYAAPRHIARDAARRLEGLPALVVGVRCPIEVVWERRRDSWGQDLEAVDDRTMAAVERWQAAVHDRLDYDLEVDTSLQSPTQCADAIVIRLAGPAGTCLTAAGMA